MVAKHIPWGSKSYTLSHVCIFYNCSFADTCTEGYSGGDTYCDCYEGYIGNKCERLVHLINRLPYWSHWIGTIALSSILHWSVHCASAHRRGHIFGCPWGVYLDAPFMGSIYIYREFGWVGKCSQQSLEALVGYGYLKQAIHFGYSCQLMGISVRFSIKANIKCPSIT